MKSSVESEVQVCSRSRLSKVVKRKAFPKRELSRSRPRRVFSKVLQVGKSGRLTVITVGECKIEVGRTRANVGAHTRMRIFIVSSSARLTP